MRQRNGHGFFLPLQGAANPAIAEMGDSVTMHLHAARSSTNELLVLLEGIREGLAGKAALN